MRKQTDKPLGDLAKIDLAYLVNQGVLLLNTKLAVRAGRANSLTEVDWDKIIVPIIEVLNKSNNNIVWMLWGNHAISYSKYLNNPNHLVLTHEHPAAASRDDREWDCNHFRRANIFFEERKLSTINWI